LVGSQLFTLSGRGEGQSLVCSMMLKVGLYLRLYIYIKKVSHASFVHMFFNISTQCDKVLTIKRVVHF